MKKYKTIAAAVAVGLALSTAFVAVKDDVLTAYADLKAAARKARIKLEIKALTYMGKKNLDEASALAVSANKATEARRKNIEEAARKAERIVELKKALEA